MGVSVTKLRNHAVRKLRAFRIIEARILGRTLNDIGSEFNLTRQTVMNEIEWAERNGLLAQFENDMLKALVPKAITAVAKTLDGNNPIEATAAAFEVFKGTGLLRKQQDKPTAQPGTVEESLEVHVKRITPPKAPIAALSAPSGRLLEDSSQRPALIEAEVVESRGEAGAQDPDGGMALADYLEQQRIEPAAT